VTIVPSNIVPTGLGATVRSLKSPLVRQLVELADNRPRISCSAKNRLRDGPGLGRSRDVRRSAGLPIVEAFSAGMRAKPQTTFATMNTDILEATVPGYVRPDFCDYIRGSHFDT
jgi:hypothetical protein